MAVVTYGVTSPQLTLNVQMELSDANSERIVNYLMNGTPYGQVTENVQSQALNPAWNADQPDPNDPPEYITVQQWVTRQATTPNEAITAYATSVMNDLLAQAFQWDQQVAATTAAENVPPITPVSPPAPVE